MNANRIRKTLALGGLGLAALACGAAPSAAGPLSWGVKGGLVGATFRDDLAMQSYETKLGLSLGAFGTYSFENWLALQAEAHYVQRGASEGESQATSMTGEDLGTFETFHVRDELEIGILARMTPVRDWKLRPYLLVGPLLMIELSEKSTAEGAAQWDMSVDRLESTGFGVSVGAGTELPLGPGRWLLEARYDWGLSNIARDTYAEEQHTASWRVLTGYAF